MTRVSRGSALRLVATLTLACSPATTRPSFPPVPEAATTEVRLPPREATRLLAEALQADSIPAARVMQRDAWLETRWFDAASGQRTSRRAVGPGVVRVRAWADPTQPGSSRLTVETVYRPLADPSLPERELDRQVPRDHPVATKVRAALQDLVKRYGGPPAPSPGRTVNPLQGDESQPNESDQSGSDSVDTEADSTYR
jgi:hypothetical protein